MAITKISVRGARQHNLKNIDVEIPRNTFTVITGLSGSGKSSLAFDTIYAEGQRRYVETLSAYARQFLDQMERPDVDAIDGLSRLRDAGFRMAALTNSTSQVAEAQLQYAGLRDFFEQALSADMAKRLKPAREAYHMAAQRLGVEPADMRMIAAHAWDVTGAMRAGCIAAFVARPGMVLDPAGEQPDIVGAHLGELVDPIIARDRD